MFEVDIHCCQGERDRCLGFAQAWIQDILIGKNDSELEYLYSLLSPSKIYAPVVIIPMYCKFSYPNATLKIFREDATNYSPITQSASEDQNMSAAPQSGPSNFMDPRSQDTSDLSGFRPQAISARVVEDYCAAAGKVVGETAKPNDPSEWISKLIDGINTAKDMIDAFKDMSSFLAINSGF